MTARSRAALAALGLVLAGSGAGAAERPSVDGWPGHAVGKVNIRGGGFCTATLIAPDQALTAAHCLRDRQGAWYPVNRMVMELAPHRAGRKGHALVQQVIPAPGLAWTAEGQPAPPARDWAILDLEEGSARPAGIHPVRIASGSERAGLMPGSRVVLVAYTPQRPFIATLAEGCQIREIRGEPEILLHDCASSAAIAGAPVLIDTADGPAMVGIQVGTGALDGEPVGVAALLERTIEPDALAGGAVP